jgi:hypothetical protein
VIDLQSAVWALALSHSVAIVMSTAMNLISALSVAYRFTIINARGVERAPRLVSQFNEFAEFLVGQRARIHIPCPSANL